MVLRYYVIAFRQAMEVIASGSHHGSGESQRGICKQLNWILNGRTNRDKESLSVYFTKKRKQKVQFGNLCKPGKK